MKLSGECCWVDMVEPNLIFVILVFVNRLLVLSKIFCVIGDEQFDPIDTCTSSCWLTKEGFIFFCEQTELL